MSCFSRMIYYWNYVACNIFIRHNPNSHLLFRYKISVYKIIMWLNQVIGYDFRLFSLTAVVPRQDSASATQRSQRWSKCSVLYLFTKNTGIRYQM